MNGSNARPAFEQTNRTSTNFTPFLKDSAGNGSARMNIVNTGAINDIGQLTICENSIDNAVASAIRRMRILAISILITVEAFVSERISQNARDSDIDLAYGIKEPMLTRVCDHRSLRSDAYC